VQGGQNVFHPARTPPWSERDLGGCCLVTVEAFKAPTCNCERPPVLDSRSHLSLSNWSSLPGLTEALLGGPFTVGIASPRARHGTPLRAGVCARRNHGVHRLTMLRDARISRRAYQVIYISQHDNLVSTYLTHSKIPLFSAMSTSAKAPTHDEGNHTWQPITLPSYPLTAVLADDFGANIAGEMCLVHNVIIRSLGSIWRNAPLVTPKDLPAFICYSKTALEMLHEHHHTEEEVFFPVLAKEGLAGMVEGNVEQHKAFHDAMSVLNEYFLSLEKDASQYDAGKLRGLMQTLGEPLVSHLHEEVKCLPPSHFASYTY
jgi:Hemerythrin HHE cation binding domain